MSEQITLLLKHKLDDLGRVGEIDAETRRNILKEELQYYVLNFIYHHANYSEWIMYGGSALRIIHGLDRMSVDLDFEIQHAITDEYLEKLKREVEDHFASIYGTSGDFLGVKITQRGVLLKFYLSEELSFGHPSRQVHVKIDLNNFVAPKTVTERRPINRDQLSFVILTYNVSSLMASKIAAIFQRGTRGVGNVTYEEKGRDIYDLLWYMGKKVVPDFDYLIAKGVDTKDPRALFDKLTLKMNSVSDTNLKQDLSPLFVNRTYIENWLKNWRESYLQLLSGYKIRSIKGFGSVSTRQDFHSDIFYFVYSHTTDDGGLFTISYLLGGDWIELPVKDYEQLFREKNETYFKKMNNLVFGDGITTKIIRMTADNLNQNEQIVLNASALRSCELDDLLK